MVNNMSDKIKELLKRTEEKFFARLERKTGWGKEEVKSEYVEASREAVREMLLDMLDTIK